MRALSANQTPLSLSRPLKNALPWLESRMTTQSQAPDTNMGENYEGPTPTQPVHPSVEPHLDRQYLVSLMREHS